MDCGGLSQSATELLFGVENTHFSTPTSMCKKRTFSEVRTSFEPDQEAALVKLADGVGRPPIANSPRSTSSRRWDDARAAYLAEQNTMANRFDARAAAG
jgi:hypothetical protein